MVVSEQSQIISAIEMDGNTLKMGIGQGG